MMPVNKRIPLSFFLIAGLAAFSYSCRNTAPAAEEKGDVKTPVTVVTVTVKSVASTLDLPAMSKYMKKNIVRALTTGVIEKILIKQGETVDSGELLFTIRTREAQALHNMQGKDSTLSFRGLIGVSAHEAGVVNSISYQLGDLVQEGDELAVISDLRSLVFILELPFEYAKFAEINKKVNIILPDGTKITGTITGKLPDMEIQSQTVSYVIKPVSPDRLPANLIATVSVIRSVIDKAQLLPKEAVLSNETQTEFWVMKLINDTTAVRINVRKGYESTGEIQITEPLFRAADRIVLTGNYGLADTAGVVIMGE